MKGLMTRAKKDPGMLWPPFHYWYGRHGGNDMPCWIIERMDGDEVHVHLWDYATEAIEESLRNFCAKNKLELSAEVVENPLPERRLCISRNGKPLLQMHNTPCSMPDDFFICVHLRPDGPAIRTLLVLFEISIDPESLAFHRKLYRQARPGLENLRPGGPQCHRRTVLLASASFARLRFHRWHIDGPGTEATAMDPKST